MVVGVSQYHLPYTSRPQKKCFFQKNFKSDPKIMKSLLFDKVAPKSLIQLVQFRGNVIRLPRQRDFILNCFKNDKKRRGEDPYFSDVGGNPIKECSL